MNGINSYLEQERKIVELQQRVTSLENLCYSAKEVLNLEEASLFLGISRSMIYKMTHSGELPFYKPAGKLIFFEKVHLMEWVRQNRVKSRGETMEEAARKMQELNHVPDPKTKASGEGIEKDSNGYAG
mgnify:CR=1 FL=1